MCEWTEGLWVEAAKAATVKAPKAPKPPKPPKLMTPAAPPLVVNELICKRVQRFWPDEGGWFDAIITGASRHGASRGYRIIRYAMTKNVVAAESATPAGITPHVARLAL